MPPASIPTAEPRSARLGDTWRWDRSLPDYTPADGWTATYRYRGKGSLDVAGDALVDGTGWSFTVPATSTIKLNAGDYEWTLEVSQGGERYTVDSGILVALVNLQNAKPGELVSFESRIIETLESYLAGATEDGILESIIAGRQVKVMSPKEARDLLTQFRNDRTRRRHGGQYPMVETVFRPL